MTDQTSESQKSPNPVDLHVGGRVRMRRRMLGVSQERLAEALGLTFQQVQKYERGSNRVSASKLYGIALALEIPVGYFFEGLPEHRAAATLSQARDEERIHAFMSTTVGAELMRLFPLVHSSQLQQGMLEFLRAVVEQQRPA